MLQFVEMRLFTLQLRSAALLFQSSLWPVLIRLKSKTKQYWASCVCNCTTMQNSKSYLSIYGFLNITWHCNSLSLCCTCPCQE